MPDNSSDAPRTQYIVLAIFFGAFVSSMLPKEGFGEYGILVRALIVGIATAIAGLSIQWIQNRLSKN